MNPDAPQMTMRMLPLLMVYLGLVPERGGFWKGADPVLGLNAGTARRVRCRQSRNLCTVRQAAFAAR